MPELASARLRTFSVAVCLGLAVAGCGGGGSSVAGAGTAPTLTLSRSNAQATATAAITVNGGITNAATVPPGGSAALASSSTGLLGSVDRRVARRLLASARKSISAVGDDTQTDPCAVSGEVTTVTSADGKSASVSFAACAELPGFVMNGTQAYTNLVLTLPTMMVPKATLSADVAIDMTLLLGAYTEVERGGYSFAFSADITPGVGITRETFGLTGTRLMVTVSNGGTLIETATLSNFNLNYVEDLTVVPHELDSTLTYTINSMQLGGQFQVRTLQTLRQVADPLVARLFPFAGQLEFDGASGTRLLMTIRGDETYIPPAGQGQIEYQLDLNTGTFGAPFWGNWAGLIPSPTPSGPGGSGTPTYSIGGTVTGLAGGAPVVLLDNGGDPLTLTTNGTFTFLTSLAGGAAYSVSVLPGGAACTVANGAGTVGTTPVTNVVVTCSGG